MIEEDFGSMQYTENIASVRLSDDKFEDFWCINVENLKGMSLEALEEARKQKFTSLMSKYNVVE